MNCEKRCVVQRFILYRRKNLCHLFSFESLADPALRKLTGVRAENQVRQVGNTPKAHAAACAWNLGPRIACEDASTARSPKMSTSRKSDNPDFRGVWMFG